MPRAPLLRSRSRRKPPPEARRVVALYNGFQLLFNLHWWMPVFYFYQRESGLSDAEIFGIQSIYYVAFCVLEMPTGMIADRIGPRRCLGIGAVMMTVANLTPVAQPSYTGFLVHFLLIATARSLVSGAAGAYLYESLHARGAGEHYLQAEGTARALGLTAKVVCWPLAGLLMTFAPSAPYWLSALCCAAAVLCALALPSLHGATGAREPNDEPGPRPGGTVHRITRALRLSPLLGPLILQGIAVFTLARLCQVHLFQPLLLEKDISTAHHGSVLAAMTIAEAVTAARPRWILRHLGGANAVALLSVVMAACLAATVFSGGFATIGWLCLFAAAGGTAFPIQRRLVNEAIPPGSDRVTLLSLESLIDRGACALAALAIGAYLSAGRLDDYLVHAAIATCLLLAAVRLVMERARRSRRGTGTGEGEADDGRTAQPAGHVE